MNCGFGHSSDTYFFQVAGMLGADRLAYWGRQYGFGKPTGIDLPGEVSGIVPSNQWKVDAFGQPMFGGEVYQSGIGQGYDVVTPIQLINAYAALANGGKLYRPQIVRDVIGPDGTVIRPFKPDLIRKMRRVRRSTLRDMRLAGALDGHAAPHVQPRRHAREGGGQVGHRGVRHSATARAGCRSTPGSWASCGKNPYKAELREGRTRSWCSWRSPTTRGPRATRARRSRRRSCSSTSTSRRTTSTATCCSAATSTAERLGGPPMRVMRAEPGRFADMTSRSVGRVGRAYDLQLTVYAALLAAVRPGHGLHEQHRGRRRRSSRPGASSSGR